MESHKGGKKTPLVSTHECDIEKGANSADGVSPKDDESREAAEKATEEKKTTTKPLWKAATAIILVAAILSIPLILSFTRFKTASIARVPLAGLFIWLEVCWGSLWVLYYGFLLLPWLVAIVSPEDLNKLNYPKLIRRLKLPLTLLFWTITSWATTTPIICYSNRHLCVASWVNILRKVLSATMVVAAIFLVEQFLMKLILVDNIRNFLGPRKYIICRYFNILGELADEGSPKKRGKTRIWLCQRLCRKPREDEKIKTLLSPTPKVGCVWGVDKLSTLDQDEEDRVSILTMSIWKMLIKSTRGDGRDGSEKEAGFEPKELKSIILESMVERFMRSHETLVIKKDKLTPEWIKQGLDRNKEKIPGWIEALVKYLLAILKEDKQGLEEIKIKRVLDDHNKEIAKHRIKTFVELEGIIQAHDQDRNRRMAKDIEALVEHLPAILKEDKQRLKQRLEEIMEVPDHGRKIPENGIKRSVDSLSADLKEDKRRLENIKQELKNYDKYAFEEDPLAILKGDEQRLEDIKQVFHQDHNKEITKDTIQALVVHLLTISSHETYAHVIKDDKQRLEDIMQALDLDHNEKITRDSIERLVKHLLISYKKCHEGVKHIKNIIQFLDRTLLVVVLIVGGLVYGIFLNQGFASHLTTAWLVFTGLSFAIAGTVTEFFAACFFVFVKHPYHSGDEVAIDEELFTVRGIHLMHSTFINEDGDVVQIPHSELQTMRVTNFSRSDSGRKELLRIRPAAVKRYKKETEKKAKEAKWRELLTIYGQLRSNEGTSKHSSTTSGSHPSTKSIEDQFIKDAKRVLEYQVEDCSRQINKLEEE